MEEVDQNGNILGRYTRGTAIDEPLSTLRGGVTSYYEADGLTSITSLSNSTGALANTYTYDSYGKLTASTGTLTNPFQYTSRELDPETGIYEYRARYYDPVAGRFLSEDPIRFKGGIDFYVYALGSPTNWRDPSGLDVTIYLYPGAMGQGHIGIAVNGSQSIGFYPLTMLPNNVIWGPGIVRPDTRVPLDTIIIPTTTEQDAAIQQYISSHMGLNNGNYSLTSRNCARFVEHALSAGGVTSSNTVYPWTLMNNLHQLYDPRPSYNTQIPLGDGLYWTPDSP